MRDFRSGREILAQLLSSYDIHELLLMVPNNQKVQIVHRCSESTNLFELAMLASGIFMFGDLWS